MLQPSFRSRRRKDAELEQVQMTVARSHFCNTPSVTRVTPPLLQV